MAISLLKEVAGAALLGYGTVWAFQYIVHGTSYWLVKDYVPPRLVTQSKLKIMKQELNLERRYKELGLDQEDES